jgi:hypothetical protein
MQTATVDVTFVKPPAEGKQYGSIKGANNEWWPVKQDRIREFEPGNKYELAYTESDKGFKNIIGVKKIAVEPQQRAEPRGDFQQFTEPQRNGAAPAKPNGQQYYQPRPTAPRDAERMFVCSLLNAFIETGRCECETNELKARVEVLRKVWQETFGQDDLR